ncbi:TetR/AcrR family transcriptional regulator [Rathayibacter sp. VKM Ac-2929]|uniref:TetR/AcrR family transcriptional regulator n=1 Tax=Rathayibacter sp. VKM Ac-2929 TaxID=2929480 RepID=UPI001FB3EAB4|nr:TetR/AcrR family transcriptional regulator [Rathayibacter sp. VKM Ac-2929]MCJ1675540.1 TetR/AcrR family transcriptional regulator [Rathayibacter sp. VKM Ac-2929]
MLEAARELIEELGLDGLTLAAVAERAGVAVGTVYNRFEDRAHLVEEVVGQWTEQVSVTFGEYSEQGNGSADPEASFLALAHLFRENRVFIRQFLIHAPLQPGIAARIAPWLEKERSRLVAGLATSTVDRRSRADLAATMVLATLERSALTRVDDEAYWARLEVDLPAAGAAILA